MIFHPLNIHVDLFPRFPVHICPAVFKLHQKKILVRRSCEHKTWKNKKRGGRLLESRGQEHAKVMKLGKTWKVIGQMRLGELLSILHAPERLLFILLPLFLFFFFHLWRIMALAKLIPLIPFFFVSFWRNCILILQHPTKGDALLIVGNARIFNAILDIKPQSMIHKTCR